MTAFASDTIGNVHVSVWTSATDLEDIQRLEREIVGLAARQTGAVGLLLVVTGDAPPAGPAAREAAVSMIRRLGDRIGAVAVVIESEGFHQAALRAVFTGLSLVLRPGFPWKTFGDVDTAIRYLDDELSGRGSPTSGPLAVRDLVHEIRAAT